MPQQQSNTAAQVAFQSDIARALARRTGDMPLHSQVAANDAGADEKRDEETQQEKPQ